MEKNDKLDAEDILDWNYLCQIGELIEEPRTWSDGAKLFAYQFTSASSTEARNTMLQDLLLNATYKQSSETIRDVICALAKTLRANEEGLEDFARRIGIKFKS